MKSIVLYTILLVSSVVAGAQTTKRITLEFSQNDFEIQKEGSQYSIITKNHTYVFDNDYQNPALPYACINILIGKNGNYIGNAFSTEQILMGEDLDLVTNPICIPVDKDSDASKLFKQSNHYKERFYPIEKVRYTGTNYLGEYKFLSFLICPFEYDAEKGNLFLDTTINIDIKLDNAVDNRDNNTPSKKSALEQIVKLVANPEDVDLLYQTENLRHFYSDTLYHYLIITVDSLKDEYQRLADWKTEKGCRAEVVTLEEINNTYTTDTTFVRIKKMIKNYYNRRDWDLQYVLLGGATNLIPTLKCYSRISFINGNEYTNGACDIYYSCLRDIDWDKNHNGIYGEITDTIDYFQWCSVSRMSTENALEAKTNVDKVIEYEQNPDTIGWKNEILMCGNKLDRCVAINESGDSISDAQVICDSLYSRYISSTGWNGLKYRFYDTGTDHPDSANYDVTAENLQSELEKGYAFAHVLTHGNTNRWTMERLIWYHTYHANNLVSPRYTVIMTEACHTNDISSPSSFLGKSFMNSPRNGIIAYYGCSETSITYGSNANGPADIFTGEAWKALFSGTPQIGKAIKESRNLFSSACNSYCDTRWQYLFMTLLGDPELTIHTQKPQPISNMQITHRYEDISWVFAEDNAKVCVMSRFDMGQSYYSVWDYYGQPTFTLQPNEYLVTVTRANCLPYQTIFGNVVYLQNEKLSNNLNVLAEQVNIGSDVNSNRPQGPVVVENGSSTISAEFGTKIYSDFEVKLGASLEINGNSSITQ